MNAAVSARPARPVIETRGLGKVYSAGTEAEVVAHAEALLSELRDATDKAKAALGG